MSDLIKLSVIEAAANIIDVMMGGDRTWRSRLNDSEFLESADWQQAVAYAEAALRVVALPAVRA